MKSTQKIAGMLMTMVIVNLILLGCASMFMKGGTLVPKDYEIPKTIVAYSAEGIVPEGVEYLLVETDQGMAIFERSTDGSGALFQTHWKDELGDHFAGWVLTGPAYEFIVPSDRSREARKYFYPKGSYSFKELNGVSRPVPNNPNTKPVARLIPK